MKLGYSKINIIDTHKSRSLDFSSSSSDLPTPNSTISKTHLDQIQMKTNITAKTAQHSYSSSPSSSSSSSSSSSLSPGKKLDDDHKEELERKEVEEVENDVGEITRKSADHHHKAVFGSDKYNQRAAMLRRNSSVSSMSAVKRVFSMRRSSSVSEGYSRIDDRLVTLASPIDDEDEQDKTRSANNKKKNRGGKILKACKRLFGL